MFIDDPKAEEFDKFGTYFPEYSNDVGKKLTLEQAQKVWERDQRTEDIWYGRESTNSNRYKAI